VTPGVAIRNSKLRWVLGAIPGAFIASGIMLVPAQPSWISIVASVFLAVAASAWVKALRTTSADLPADCWPDELAPDQRPPSVEELDHLPTGRHIRRSVAV
jgi:hypothetical protein